MGAGIARGWLEGPWRVEERAPRCPEYVRGRASLRRLATPPAVPCGTLRGERPNATERCPLKDGLSSDKRNVRAGRGALQRVIGDLLQS